MQLNAKIHEALMLALLGHAVCCTQQVERKLLRVLGSA